RSVARHAAGDKADDEINRSCSCLEMIERLVRRGHDLVHPCPDLFGRRLPFLVDHLERVTEKRQGILAALSYEPAFNHRDGVIQCSPIPLLVRNKEVQYLIDG